MIETISPDVPECAYIIHVRGINTDMKWTENGVMPCQYDLVESIRRMMAVFCAKGTSFKVRVKICETHKVYTHMMMV
jgi:hypothetical protein